MKVFKLFLILLVAIGSLAACGNFKKINIDQVSQERVRQISSTKVIIELKAKVDNPTAHALVLRKANFEILRKGFLFAEAKLRNKVKIPAHSHDYHTIQLDVDVIDFMAVMTRSVDFTKFDETYTAEGFVKAGTALFCKKYRFENVSMAELQEMLLKNAGK